MVAVTALRRELVSLEDAVGVEGLVTFATTKRLLFVASDRLGRDDELPAVDAPHYAGLAGDVGIFERLFNGAMDDRVVEVDVGIRSWKFTHEGTSLRILI